MPRSATASSLNGSFGLLQHLSRLGVAVVSGLFAHDVLDSTKGVPRECSIL